MRFPDKMNKSTVCSKLHFVSRQITFQHLYVLCVAALAMKGKIFVFDYDTRQVGWETSICKISNLLQRTTSKKRRMIKLGTI